MYRRWWLRLNVSMFVAVLSLCCIGWLVVYSATGQVWKPNSDAFRQAIYICVGLGLMALFTALDYEVLGRLARPMYVGNLLLLVSVLAIGQHAKGAQRWIGLGPLGTFQPSELAKLVLIITLSRYLAVRAEENPAKACDATSLGTALLHIGVPFCAIMLQPDLGTALVLIAVLLVSLFVVGVNPIYLTGIVVAGLGLSPLLLKEYQRNRLLIFLNPETDPTGLGYNLMQSETAIGSGKMWGAGLFAGHMSQLKFVPEHSTDFIFSVVGEELGFVGSMALVALYVFLLVTAMRAAIQSRDLFGTLLVTGISTMIGFHVFVNIGMTLGVMPVTGIPLPLVSYGGSAMLTNLMALGVVGSVYLRGGPTMWNRT